MDEKAGLTMERDLLALNYDNMVRGSGRIGIQTHLFLRLPLINYYKYQQPLQSSLCKRSLILPKAWFLGSWPPTLVLAVGRKTQSDAASPLSPTNGKAVANTGYIFSSSVLWNPVGRLGLCPGGTRRERGGERRGREEGGGVGGKRGGEEWAWRRGRVCDALPLADAQGK